MDLFPAKRTLSSLVRELLLFVLQAVETLHILLRHQLFRAACRIALNIVRSLRSRPGNLAVHSWLRATETAPELNTVRGAVRT
jgi:hypothetical protein